jgi:hypothetical protein
MRGWTPLFAAAALLTASAARAQPSFDVDEPQPTPTPQSPTQQSPTQQSPAQQSPTQAPLDDEDDEPSPAPSLRLPPTYAPAVTLEEQCCRPQRPRHLLLKLSVGATYRRAFGDDFFAAMPELEIGGQTDRFSIGARVNAALGTTRVGLPFQYVNLGPNLMFRQSPRVMIGFGLSLGFFMYERASAAAANDPVVWSPSFGATLAATIDLVRSASGGALFADVRVMADELMTLHGGFVDGLSVAPVVSLGWRL